MIGTHDGEFGEWVPVALKNKANITLVEASDKQFNRLSNNYKDYHNVKCIQSLVTPNGGKVEFFEGGEGYTNSVVEKVIRDWEIEEIKSTFRESISIVNLIDKHCGGNIDWLHLDVEGLDSELIKSLSYVEDKLPNFIIFEDNNYNQIEKNDIHLWLINLGYRVKSLNGICEAIK